MMHLRRDLNLEIATDDDGGNKLPLLLATIFALQFAIPDFHNLIHLGNVVIIDLWNLSSNLFTH